MKSSIFFILGLVLTFGAMGGIDHAVGFEVIGCMAIAFVGLSLMGIGVNYMKEGK